MSLQLSQGLAPVWQADAQILILGSLPGVASLQAAQYYAHPRNQFWPLMQALFGIELALPYEARLQQLQQHRVALWDLIASAHRPGSLDSAIDAATVELNDLATLFAQLPQLQAIWFNGGTAWKSWQRLQKGKALAGNWQLCPLPSTSPAHASVTFADKLALWRQAQLAQTTGATDGCNTAITGASR